MNEFLDFFWEYWNSPAKILEIKSWHLTWGGPNVTKRITDLFIQLFDWFLFTFFLISEEYEFTNIEIKHDNLLQTFDCWGMEFTISFDINLIKISSKISSIHQKCHLLIFHEIRLLKEVKKELQKDLNNNSPHLGYRLHSKLKAIQGALRQILNRLQCIGLGKSPKPNWAYLSQAKFGWFWESLSHFGQVRAS